MKASYILRAAAETVYNGEWTGACGAIMSQYSHANEDSVGRANAYFSSLFKPANAGVLDFWFSARDRDEQRIIALLLTADMAESVGD